MVKEKLVRIRNNSNVSRIVALVLSLLLCVSIVGIISSAASTLEDGLEVTLVTDKEEYTATEPIVATLNVENKGSQAVNEVNLETLIPDGYYIDSETTSTKEFVQLEVGEKAVLEVSLLPKTNSPPLATGIETPEANSKNNNQESESTSSLTSSTTNKDGRGSSTTPTNSSKSSIVSTALTRNKETTFKNDSSAIPSANKYVGNVNTQDNSNIWLWAVLSFVCFIGLFLMVKKGDMAWKGTLSILLAGAFLGSTFSGLSIGVKAESIHHYTISAKANAKVLNNQLDINGLVTINPNVNDYSNGDYIYLPNKKHIQYDNNENEIYYDNLVCVYLNDVLNENKIEVLAKSVGGSVAGHISGVINYLQIMVPAQSFNSLNNIITKLSDMDEVMFATYDLPIPIGLADSNPWPDEEGIAETEKGLDYNPGGNDWWAEAIQAYSAWNYIDNNSAVKEPVVGIIDSGFYNHEDLNNYSFAEGFPANSPTNHGTHVAGLVAATNNSIGIRGVADKAALILGDWQHTIGDLEVNFLDDEAYINHGVYVEITKEMIESGAKVVNNSWCAELKSKLWDVQWESLTKGANLEKKLEQRLKALEKTAENAMSVIVSLKKNHVDDFIIVQAAGNGFQRSINDNMNWDSPGVDALYSGYYCGITKQLYDKMRHLRANSSGAESFTYGDIRNHIVIVGAVENKRDSNGNYFLTDFSNYGANVDIVAPGAHILSLTGENGYAFDQGTSMAAPIVSGAISVIWGMNPTLSAGEIKQLIVQSNQSAVGIGIDSNSVYPMLNVFYSLSQSPALNNDEPSHNPSDTPGDISGIDDSEPSQGNNGHYYKVFDDDLTWDEAKSICESYGGHLVTITSQQENKIVSDLVENGSMGAYWIGAQRDDDWKWITGEDFTYSNWQPDRPDDNESGMVIQLFNNNVYENQLGLWDDTWTDGDHAAGLREQGYVCEWDNKQAYDSGIGFASGSGTEEDPYVITTPAELNHVRHHLSSSFILGNDIDMAAWNNWEPIGKEEYEKDFAGVFDGNNKTIKNLHLGENADKESNHALFGEVSGTLTNIIIDNLTITINHEELIHDGEIENWYQLIGGLLLHGGNVDNCKVSGNITVSSLTTPVIEGGAGLSIGGISAGSSNIRNCESNVNIRVTGIEKDISISAGGISGDGGVIHDCINKGAISTENVFYGMLGGIAGEGFWSKITNCSNFGDVKNTLSDISLKEEYLYGEFLNVGGIAGRTGTAYDVETIISNCYNYASCVQNDGSSTRVGRIFGSCDGLDESSLEISNNYSIKSTLVNGVIPREGIAANQKNGANL